MMNITNKLLSNLDHTAQHISRTKTYSTRLGKILGVAVFILLIFAFVMKIIEMIDKGKMDLNSF